MLNLTGSGTIDLNQSKIETASFNLIGSGDIKNFYINQNASLSLTGSGDIKGSCSQDANIVNSKIGSGKIKIKKID